MWTWLDDVGEVLPSDGSEGLVHVLQESRRDEEAGFEPLGMGISLPLQQLECLPLVVVLEDDLLSHRQDPDAEAASWDCRNFFFFTGCMWAVTGVDWHAIPRRRRTPRASPSSRECLLDLLLGSSYHGACKRLVQAIPKGNKGLRRGLALVVSRSCGALNHHKHSTFSMPRFYLEGKYFCVFWFMNFTNYYSNFVFRAS